MTGSLSVGPAKFCRGGDITFARYGTGETAILIERDGAREAVATVCLAGVPGSPAPGPHQVWLKGWSENEGIPQALEAAGVVNLTGQKTPTGFCEAELADLTPEAITARAQTT